MFHTRHIYFSAVASRLGRFCRRIGLALMAQLLLLPCGAARAGGAEDSWERDFRQPPAAYRPEVYWDWMGGLISKPGITRDLEALARAGIGGVLIMQLPDQLAGVVQWRFRDYPGKVRCLSEEWFGMMNHAALECHRLGLRMSFLMCPGWSHCGGPWIQPAQGLKMLVSARTPVTGPARFEGVLARAPIHKPGGEDRVLPGGPDARFWEQALNPTRDFYQDTAVVALPDQAASLPVALTNILDLTGLMDRQGRLAWEAPPGKWIIHRLGVASQNGPNHPAPPEAMGLECDRMDPAAVRAVFQGMTARIVREARARGCQSVQRFETDSYEAGFQDFCPDFPEQFRQRRGYDCRPWLPAWLEARLVIASPDWSARFRHDMLRTISELWTERFYGELRRLAAENRLEWMLEPYFMLHHDWRTAAARAHLPGCEFWVGGPQLNGPAADAAALTGRPVVWAEAFTAESWESAWRNDPWRLKPFGDAAFCRGINHFIMHGFTHNPWEDRFQPGLTMGLWGTQMSRHATWWPFALDWHRYLARCQFLLQQGEPVVDALSYPPKAEHIPGPVVDAGPYRQAVLNDETLLQHLSVRGGKLVLPHGASCAALALAPGQPLRPEALRRIRGLVREGATLIGAAPPARSPSLENFPACDGEVAQLVQELWGEASPAASPGLRTVGQGRVVASQPVASVLATLTGGPGFQCQPLNIPFFAQETPVIPRVLFTHRRTADRDLFFLSNQEDQPVAIRADFRVAAKAPELWDPASGEIRPLRHFQAAGSRTFIPLHFEPRQAFFVVFRLPLGATQPAGGADFPALRQMFQFSGAWEVDFDPQRGGPGRLAFDALADWTQRSEPGIRYYSGPAAYRREFDLPAGVRPGDDLFLDLGLVRNLARLRLNERDLGVVWCAPWRWQISGGLRPSGNRLEITVVNTWVNRLIGDEQEPEDADLVLWNPPDRKGGYAREVAGRGLKDLPAWLLEGTARPSPRRFTFTSWRFYPKEAPLELSGLLGPVTLLRTEDPGR